MSLDLNEIHQQTLFVQCDYRTHINIPKDHPLVVLNQSLPWADLMEQTVPLLYQNHGICIDVGRRLNLRAHLGAYILQSVHNWTDRWTEEMLKYYVPARIFCGFLESSGSLDHTKIEEFRNRLGEPKDAAQPAFEDRSAQTGTADGRGSMGLSVIELGGILGEPDGLPDLFITHWIAQENAFYQSLKPEGQSLEYRDRTRQLRLGEISI